MPELFRVQEILNIDISLLFPSEQEEELLIFQLLHLRDVRHKGAAVGVVQEKCHRFVFSQLKDVKCFVKNSEISQAATPELLRAKTQNNQGDFGLFQAQGVPGTPLTLCCQSWSIFHVFL